MKVKGFDRIMKATCKTPSILVSILACLAMSVVSAGAPDFDYTLKPEIEQALTDRDTARVLTLLDNEINLDPAYAPHYLLKGRIFYARQQYDKALEEFETALEKKSKLYEAMYYQGLVLLHQGKLEEAKKVFNSGLKKSKEERALFHNGMGLLLLEKKEYNAADVEFRKAISIGPDEAEFHANLGDANYFAEIYPLAISEYTRVIEMDTTFLDVYFRLARAYVAQGQYNDALNQLRTVLSRDSLYTHAWLEIGRLYTMAGLSADDRDLKVQRFTEAIGSYKKYLELSNDSTAGEVFFNIGRSYFNLGGFAQADSAFEHVLALGDVPKNIYLYLGRGYVAEERFDEGIEYLQKHLDWMAEQDPDWKPGPSEADVYRRMADAYKAKEDWTGAARYYVMAFDLTPEDARIAVEAAVAYHRLQDYPKALEYYDKRIALGPDAWNVYLNAAYCTLNMEDFEKSVQYLLTVVELDSTQEKAYSLLSNTYLYQLQDCENGVLWTEKWLALDTTNCEGHKSLGFAYFGGICPPAYLRAINYFDKALSCFKAKGMNNCASTDLMLYIAQAYHLHAANLLENDKKQESKTYFKNAFDWYNKVLKCDPGNADAKKGVSDTEFEF